jgi:Flp pilus assembly protein TadG
LAKHFNNQFEVILAGSSRRRCKDFPMPSLAASKAAASNILRRFRRSRAGSAAVEFALVAPVFFALLFAIIEVALMFFASQVLETITQDSARMLMTGQGQTGQVCVDPASGALAPCTLQSFQTYACSQIPASLFNCTGLYVDVENYPAGFSSITINNQISGGAFTSANMAFNPGGPGAVVVVRMFYQWPLFVTGLGFNLSNLSGNKRLLVATAAFQNEPY